MSEVPVQTLEDIFKEYFPAWKDDISRVVRISSNIIQVTISKKHKTATYRFGRNKDGMIFLTSVPKFV